MLRYRRNGITFATGVLCLLLDVAAAGGQAPAPGAVTAADLSVSLQATARAVSPAVVEIYTTSYAPGPSVVPSAADLVTTERATGSGVIVDSEGYIVTNAHVVRGARRLRVSVPTSTTGQSILAARSRVVNAQVVGIDVETDLAVVKVEERNLPALTFADSDALEPGQVVLAIGSPLGFHNSVSMGVVSAIARQLEPESPMIYVQTDAVISPGSSGGPLVDVRGRLVGINTLIVSRAGGNEGLGFSAPSNIVRSVYEQIRKNGRVRRGDIGIRTQTVTPVLAAALELSRDYGVILADVIPGSPAAAAGLRRGDLVVALDGRAMENGRHLQVGLYRRVAGEVVSLDVLRGGTPLQVRVTMTERPDAFGTLAESIDPRENLVPRLGILGVNLNANIAQMLAVVRVASGVVVASTVAGGIESRDGALAAGDVIYGVNRTLVDGLAELRAVLDALRPGDPAVVHVERRGELSYVAFTVE